MNEQFVGENLIENTLTRWVNLFFFCIALPTFAAEIFHRGLKETKALKNSKTFCDNSNWSFLNFNFNKLLFFAPPYKISRLKFGKDTQKICALLHHHININD